MIKVVRRGENFYIEYAEMFGYEDEVLPLESAEQLRAGLNAALDGDNGVADSATLDEIWNDTMYAYQNGGLTRVQVAQKFASALPSGANCSTCHGDGEVDGIGVCPCKETCPDCGGSGKQQTGT